MSVGGRLFLSMLAVLVYGNLYRIAPVTVAALPTQSLTSSTTTKSKIEDSPAIPVSVLGQLTATTTNETSIKNCRIAMPAYRPATPLTLTSDSPLLTKVIETPSYYHVYGDKTAELRSSIDSCAIRATVAGPYHASTARNVNWSYSFTQLDGGMCALANPRIGLHISQLLPTFTPTATTQARTIATWNSYAANLAVHEKEHVDLAVQHVERLAASMQAVEPMRCELMRSHVDTMIRSAVLILDAQDELYDIQTNHGATQGATL